MILNIPKTEKPQPNLQDLDSNSQLDSCNPVRHKGNSTLVFMIKRWPKAIAQKNTCGTQILHKIIPL